MFPIPTRLSRHSSKHGSDSAELLLEPRSLSRLQQVQHGAQLRSTSQCNSEVVLAGATAPRPAFSDVEHHRIRRTAALLLEGGPAPRGYYGGKPPGDFQGQSIDVEVLVIESVLHFFPPDDRRGDREGGPHKAAAGRLGRLRRPPRRSVGGVGGGLEGRGLEGRRSTTRVSNLESRLFDFSTFRACRNPSLSKPELVETRDSTCPRSAPPSPPLTADSNDGSRTSLLDDVVQHDVGRHVVVGLVAALGVGVLGHRIAG